MGKLGLLTRDLNEVNLDTDLDDAAEEDLRGIKGDNLGFCVFAKEEENIKLLRGGLADLTEEEGAARVDAGGEEELEELEELHNEEWKEEEKTGPQ